MGIQAITIEIALHIISYLYPEELFHWALSCRQFDYLIRDEAVCRASIRTRPFSRECQQKTNSSSLSKWLRTHVKRRAAVHEARPFSVAVVKGVDSFVYANGRLCFTFGQNQVHLLNLDWPRGMHWSFDFRQPLSLQRPHVSNDNMHELRLLHFDHDLLSCLCSGEANAATRLHWLMVIDAKERKIITVYELDRIDDIWVCNTREWFYCGISAETEEDDVRTWLLLQLDARKGQWASNRGLISTMPNGEVGVGNCFEIFDTHLYGASSRLSVDLDSESQAWNSFYYVFRFPLRNSENVEVMEKSARWRRWPAAGNVGDRWGSLQMIREEASGEIYLYESRREFLETRSQSRRNCYRKKIVFPRRCPGEPPSWERNEPRDPLWNGESYRDDFHPSDAHRGDDWYRDTTHMVREAPIRTYVPSCRAYLDVIAQFQDSNPDQPLLHIRTRPRDLRDSSAVNSISLGKQSLEAEPAADQGVSIWPLKQDLAGQDEQLTNLLKAASPEGATQDLLWYGDERLIAYSVEPTPEKATRRIVIISSDPSVHLPGVEGRKKEPEVKKPAGDGGMWTHDVACPPQGGEPAALMAALGIPDTPYAFGLDLSS